MIADANGQGRQFNFYYPYGMPSTNESANLDKQPYKFGGKEYETMHGLNLYDFEARPYDPILGRFLTPDPLAEKYPWINPYAYCLNNPIKYIDPTGMDPEEDKKNFNFFEWLKNLFTINIDPQNIEKSKQEQEQKNETIEQLTEVVNLTADALSILNPVASVIEVAVNADAGNTDAALAALPFAILEVATAGEGKAVKGLTQWGWKGTKVWKNLVNEVKSGGTIEHLLGKIPTKDEALQLLKEGGITKYRIEEPHLSPNPHTYNHINYTTPTGGKGTIKIQ
jgi:RHS repeat-associated protein